jgi:hypothetical protein
MAELTLRYQLYKSAGILAVSVLLHEQGHLQSSRQVENLKAIHQGAIPFHGH